MGRSTIKEKDYRDLLRRILPFVHENGFKSTRMDDVASALGMSKRTLYEIFGSKSDMLQEVIKEMESQQNEFISKTFAESENVMLALISIFKRNRDLMGTINIAFFRDMDSLYKDKRKTYDKTRDKHHEKIQQLYRLGVEQGMFRSDIDYNIHSRILALQMEGLKRIEELFPPDITLQKVYDTIMLGTFRSIASPEGMKILDRVTDEILKEN